MKTNKSHTAGGGRVIYVLFGLLAVLQVLDWYTTATSGLRQTESNRLLLAIATRLPFETALAIVKSLDALLIVLLIGAWRRTNGRSNLEFLGCLAIVDLIYSPVVFNNFLHR